MFNGTRPLSDLDDILASMSVPVGRFTGLQSCDSEPLVGAVGGAPAGLGKLEPTGKLGKPFEKCETSHGAPKHNVEGSQSLEKSTVEAMENVIFQTLGFQHFLTKFEDSKVRKDFLSGRFGIRNNGVAMLDAIDIIRKLVLPGIGDNAMKLDGVSFLSGLLQRSEKEPRDGRDVPLPFRQSFHHWYKYFSDLKSNDYWDDSKLRHDQHRVGKCGKGDISSFCETSTPTKRKFPKNFSSSDGGRKSKSYFRNPGNARNKKSLANFSSDESSESSGKSEVTTDCSEDSESKKRNLVRLTKSLRLGKDAVSPGIFDGRQEESMKEFLAEYEQYFHDKYGGTNKQCARQLAQFLAGPARAAYDALDGAHCKYSKLKPLLFAWYKSEHVSQRSNYEAKFDSAHMLQNESLTIFAMRLERLARRVFRNRREYERQLQKKFAREVPASFRKVISSHERDLPATGQKITWRFIKKLAEGQDRQDRLREEIPTDEPAIWYSRPVQPPAVSPSKNFVARESLGFGRAPRVFHNQQQNPGEYSPRRTIQVCHWCGRKGHNEDSCWRKKGACLLCGSMDHNKEDCHKYKPYWTDFEPLCSKCGGSHLGQECNLN